MNCRAFLKLFIVVLLTAFLSGCGQDAPFEYDYKSRDEVQITYLGNSYDLDKNAPMQEGLPFTYQFEDDGDLNILLLGETYELESPYDIDKPKKRIKKKTTTKKTFRKSKKK